jgi:hypothetical protein
MRLDNAECAYSVEFMCRKLGVSKSGYYDWRNRPDSATAQRREELRLVIKKAFDMSDGTYGYRRVHAQLLRWGVAAGPELVRQLMRKLGLVPTCRAIRNPAGRRREPHGPQQGPLLRTPPGSNDASPKPWDRRPGKPPALAPRPALRRSHAAPSSWNSRSSISALNFRGWGTGAHENWEAPSGRLPVEVNGEESERTRFRKGVEKEAPSWPRRGQR